MLAEDNVRKGFFEREQFEQVRNRLAPLYQGVVTLAYFTGWRVNSEILTLEWRQIDRDAGVIRLEPGTTKNREGRVFRYGEISSAINSASGYSRRRWRLRSRRVGQFGYGAV
jgi:integrase